MLLHCRRGKLEVGWREREENQKPYLGKSIYYLL